MPEKVPNKPKWGADEYVQEMYPKPQKTVTYKHETFDCKWCGKAFENDRSRSGHVGWCEKNPASEGRREKLGEGQRKRRAREKREKEGKKEENPLRLNPSKIYTIKDIREIDKIIGLTADQIAKFVRGEKKE